MPGHASARRFASDALLASHIRRIHDKTGEGVRSSICEFCAKTFASSHTLLKHVQTMHSDDAAKDQHQCNICQKWLSNQYVLKAHMERHTSEPQQCPHCDKVSPNRGALGQHIHHMHGPAAKATYTCHLCAKSFKVANALKVDMLDELSAIFEGGLIQTGFLHFLLYHFLGSCGYAYRREGVQVLILSGGVYLATEYV